LVAKDNADAERLYTRLGFRRTGEEGDDYWMTADPSPAQ
jgi:ribosomal protein S18 acetylase RimI-like enzyme